MGGLGSDGAQDPDDDVLGDDDVDDAKFSTLRLAAPGWWIENDDSLGQRCHPDFPECDDTPGDEMMPPWWQPGDSDGDDTGDLAQRVDPSYFPDGNYPDDTAGDDELI